MPKAKSHPAHELYAKMFAKRVLKGTPCCPQHIVPRNAFHAACRREGIAVPSNFIAALEWENEIGLHAYVKKFITKYLKSKKA